MFKRFSVFLILFTLAICSNFKVMANSGLEISNKYFSFTMPSETKDLYTVSKEGNGIYILEKKSYKMGLGGFAFGLKIYKNPKDYANIPGNKKLGELTDAKGRLYDMVLVRPMEVEYGEGEEIQQNYALIYDVGENVEIKGINGNKYEKNKGMKGKDLYPNVLQEYKTSSPKELGYIYYDINSDGIDELFIGNKDTVYDVYTMVERRPKHVVSKGDADKFYICNDVYLCGEYSFDKKEKTMTVYSLEENSTEMYSIATFTYNANKNKKQPWFSAYGNPEVMENISKKTYKERKSFFTKQPKKLDFIPFDKI